MLEHVLKVKTLRMNGFDSPPGNRQHPVGGREMRRLPCRVTMLAIWMTGSIFASGKVPLRPAHSISKLRIRNGAIFDHSPSAG